MAKRLEPYLSHHLEAIEREELYVPEEYARELAVRDKRIAQLIAKNIDLQNKITIWRNVGHGLISEIVDMQNGVNK